jgi:hypothetical protein
LGCFWLWCFALTPRIWRGRQGVLRTLGVILARVRRELWRSPLREILIIGTVAIVAVWALAPVGNWAGLLTSLVGLAASGGIVWAVRLIGSAALRKEAMASGIVSAQGSVKRAEATAVRAPIIDVHLHAAGQAQWVRAPNPVTGKPAPETAEQHMRECLAIMERYNIIGIVDGPLEVLEAWGDAAPGRVIASLALGRPGFGAFDEPLPSVDALREMYRDGSLRAMGEVGAQYEGLSASDLADDAYFALAEELGVPVGIHTGTSFPQTALRKPGSPMTTSR